MAFCYAYIDDILIASKNEEEHLRHIKILFKRLDEYGLLINPAKCVFGAKVPQLHGKWSRYKTFGRTRPETVLKLLRFLRMINFYRHFIPKATELQQPLKEFLKGTKLKADHRMEYQEEGRLQELEN